MTPESLLKEIRSFKPPNTTKIIDPPWIQEWLRKLKALYEERLAAIEAELRELEKLTRL